MNYDQVGYIKNKHIGENIRIIKYSDLKYTFLALVEFEKAFDLIEWSFLLYNHGLIHFGQKVCN